MSNLYRMKISVAEIPVNQRRLYNRINLFSHKLFSKLLNQIHILFILSNASKNPCRSFCNLVTESVCGATLLLQLPFPPGNSITILGKLQIQATHTMNTISLSIN